jgi:pantothenate kinase type III
VQLLHRHRQQQGGSDGDDESDERHRQSMVEELGLRVQPSPPWRVGKDRLCAALGALSLASHREASDEDDDTAWVVVDSGTALTVNSVLPSPKSGTQHHARA